MELFKQTKGKNKTEVKDMQEETKKEISEEKEKIMQREELKNSETNVGVASSRPDEAKEIEGYEKTGKTEDGKEITYTYEEAKNKGNKWTTQQTLFAIAGIIAVLVVIFIIIAKREKRGEEE